MARDDNDRFAVWRDGAGNYTILYFCTGWKYTGDFAAPPDYTLVFGDVSADEAAAWLKVFGVADVVGASVGGFSGGYDG